MLGMEMLGMEMVIERGQARCPFCVSVADYRFIENDRNLVRYEVHCQSCGERYREKLGLAAVSNAPATQPWLPEPAQLPAVPLSERLRAAAAGARQRSAAVSAAVAASAAAAWQRRDVPPWLTGALARAQRG